MKPLALSALHIVSGLTLPEKSDLAASLSAAVHELADVGDAAPAVPRRNGLVAFEGVPVMGQMTDDNRLIARFPLIGLKITQVLEHGKTGWIFQPRPEVRKPAEPVKFQPVPALASPTPAPETPAVDAPAFSRADVAAFLRKEALTAPRGSASLKAAATILASL